MPVHQVFGFNLFALGQPGFFLRIDSPFQKLGRRGKTQNGHAAFFGTTATGRKVVKQQLVAQNGVHRFGQGLPLARAQPFVFAVISCNNGICRMLKTQNTLQQVGSAFKKYFGVHGQDCPMHSKLAFT